MRNVDTISIDFPTRSLDVLADLSSREPLVMESKIQPVDYRKYSKFVSSASEGAVTI